MTKPFVRAVIVMALVALSHVSVVMFIFSLGGGTLRGVSVTPTEIWLDLMGAGPLMVLCTTVAGGALLTAATVLLGIVATGLAWVLGSRRGVERLDSAVGALWAKLQ